MNLIRYSEACIQGPRDEMQDLTRVDRSPDGAYLLSVFDGHNPGGELVADQAAEAVSDIAKFRLTGLSALGIACAARTRLKNLHLDLKGQLSDTNTSRGTTAVVVAVQRDSLATAWLGDSEAVFYPDSAPAVLLTKPHNSYNRAEVERLEALGVKILTQGRTGYFGGRLAVSRAIGDFDCDFVLPEAEIKVYDLVEPGILAVTSDGVLGHGSKQEHDVVEKLVRAHPPGETGLIAEELVETMAWINQDNASAIVARIE